VLSFLANAYVWASKEEPEASSKLPQAIALPFLQVSSSLGLNPVVCHASVVLWNWTRIDPRGPLELDNVQTVHLYTGSMDESWFYLVTVAVEIAAIPGIKAIMEAFLAMEHGDPHGLLKSLETVSGLTSTVSPTSLITPPCTCDR